MASTEEQPHIDNHPHTDEEIGDEQCVADKLNAIHQWRHMRNVAIEDEAGKEGAEDSLHTGYVGKGGTHEKNGHDEDKLHHRIAVAAQKPARQPGDEPYHRGTIEDETQSKPHPKSSPTRVLMGGHKACQHEQGHEQREHTRPHTEGHTGLALQPVARDDGVGNERVGSHDAPQQQRSRTGIAE